MSEKIDKALQANLDFVDFAGKLTGVLTPDHKYELLQRGRQLSNSIKEAKQELATLTEEQKDQLGLNYSEKLFKVIE